MKSVVEWFCRNHVAANFLMFAILLGGGLSWFEMKKEIFPSLALNTVMVEMAYPTATPEEVENGICVPIEEAVQGVEGIDEVASFAAENFGNVRFKVKTGYDVRNVMSDIKSRVDAIDNFPERAEKPVVEEILIKNAVIGIAISADTNEYVLQRLAEQVRDDLLVYQAPPHESAWQRLMDGVKNALGGEASITQVEISGNRPYEISIEVSEDTLRRRGITFDQVALAVRQSSLDLPAGSVRTDAGEVLIRTQAKKYNASDFEGITVLTRPDGSVVKLSEIATVRDGFEDIELSSRFDGKPAKMVNVYRVGNEDPLRLADLVYSYVKEAPSRLPAGVRLEIWSDWSLFLRGRMDLMFGNGFQGFILVVITLGLFLQPKLAWYVSLGIPVSVAGGLLVMPFADVSVNMISLFAFILVLGVVVDDAIVIGENVYHRMNMGEPPPIAAPRGTNEVAMVVTFGVLVTVCAFLPMFGVTGVSGKIWKQIPWVVVPVLIISTIESKLILPAHLAAMRVKKREDMGILMRTQVRIADGLDWVSQHWYRPVVRKCVEWRYVMLSIFIALFILTLGVISSGVVKFLFFPEVEGDIMVAKLTMPEGVPYETTAVAIARLEAGANKLGQTYRTRDDKSVIRHMLATVGDQPFRSGFSPESLQGQSAHLGEIVLELAAPKDRQVLCSELRSKWREFTGPIPGAVELTFRTATERGGLAIDLELNGKNLDELRSAAELVKSELAQFKGVIDIADSDREGKRELKLNMLPPAEALGLRLDDMTRQVRQAFFGEEAQRLQRGHDEVKVMVRYPKSERISLDNLEKMMIRTRDGSEVPFSAVATSDYGRAYSSISRADRRRAINVTADIDLNVEDANANEVVAELKSRVLPKMTQSYPGIAWRFQGEQQDQNESVRDLSVGFVLSLFGIYVLLAVPLKSYFQPIIVMSAIPFGMVGAVAGHILLGMNLSIMSMCGVIALSGMVVNESLVLTDCVNRFRRRGMELREAAWRGGMSRFRSILATSVTTFVGLLPIMSETDIQALFLVPMSVALGFGGLFATVITLFLVPGIYVILEDIRHIIGLRPGILPDPEKTGHVESVDQHAAGVAAVTN